MQARDGNKETVLHKAARNGFAHCISLLLNTFFTPHLSTHILSHHLASSHDKSVNSTHPDRIDQCIGSVDEIDQWIEEKRKVEQRREEFMEFVNARNYDDWTPLHWSACNGRSACSELFFCISLWLLFRLLFFILSSLLIIFIMLHL